MTPITVVPAACGLRSSLAPTTARILLDLDTRRAYTSRVRQYLARLDRSTVDGDPLTDRAARDGAARDYRTYLQTVAGRKPASINTVLAALGDFYTRAGLGPPTCAGRPASACPPAP